MQQNSLQKSKGGRKRLNSQAAENVEKRRSVNLNKCETQVYILFFNFYFAMHHRYTKEIGVFPM